MTQVYAMRKVLNYAQAFIMVAFVVVFFWIGPKVESVLIPPISKFSIPAEGIEIFPNRTIISGVLVKERSQCEPIRGSFTVFVEEHIEAASPLKEIRIALHPEGKFISRPIGAQFFGPWILHAPGPPLGQVIVFRIKHKCHPFWTTESVLYRGLTSDFFSDEQIAGDPPWRGIKNGSE